MIPSQNLFDKLKEWEASFLNSYQDSAGVWTIGVGSTVYQNGKHVGKGEKITQDKADELLKWEVGNKAMAVNSLVKSTLNQNQYDALISFAFNVGVGALQTSTLLKRINANPNDKPGILSAFMMWDKIHQDGKLVESEGLKNRRQKEIELYFS